MTDRGATRLRRRARRSVSRRGGIPPGVPPRRLCSVSGAMTRRVEMKIGLLFWILVLLCLVFSTWLYWPAGGNSGVAYGPVGGSLLLLVLLGLLGWKVFGAPLQE